MRSDEPTTFDVYGYRGVHWECLRCGRLTDEGEPSFCRDCLHPVFRAALVTRIRPLRERWSRHECAVWWDELQTLAPVVVPAPYEGAL